MSKVHKGRQWAVLSLNSPVVTPSSTQDFHYNCVMVASAERHWSRVSCQQVKGVPCGPGAVSINVHDHGARMRVR